MIIGGRHRAPLTFRLNQAELLTRQGSHSSNEIIMIKVEGLTKWYANHVAVVIEAGGNLNELHAVGLRLEEIFPELTGSAESGCGGPARHHAGWLHRGQPMNTLTICRKELNSYFRSPIA